MSSAHIDVDLARQQLTLSNDSRRVFAVSTARNGAGERDGSFCTPRGRHRIRAKIGTGAPVGTVFRGRRPSGEIYTPELAQDNPGRDWILTRILWLCGEQPGFNRFGDVDTMRRYVYIHGAPDSATMGEPGSIGCIRMHNDDLLELFDSVAVGTQVNIHE